MRITLRQLEIFAAIYQEQTVTSAARRIGLSQAAASQALAELENLLQRRLFDRHGRRIRLNAAGRALLPAAVGVLDRVRNIEEDAPRQPVHLRLYASLTAGNYMLPPLIARFLRRRPDTRFHVSLGNTERVMDSLLQFESDAGWIEGVAEHRDLVAIPWRDDELVVVARPDHPLAGKRAGPPKLEGQSWVLREKGSGTRAIFERAIAGRFSLSGALVEMGGVGAVKRAVLAGAGLGCLSRSAVEDELRTRRLRRVYTPWLNLRRKISILLHRQKHVDAGLREFLDFCGARRLAGQTRER